MRPFGHELREAWRRRRARRFLQLDRETLLEFDTASAGIVELRAIFSAEGERLDVKIVSLYGRSFLDGDEIRPVGLPELFKGRDFICGLAADAGYSTVRFLGRRLRPDRKQPRLMSYEVRLEPRSDDHQRRG